MDVYEIWKLNFDPIRKAAWKCNSPRFLDGIMTDRPTDHLNDRPTDRRKDRVIGNLYTSDNGCNLLHTYCVLQLSD